MLEPGMSVTHGVGGRGTVERSVGSSQYIVRFSDGRRLVVEEHDLSYSQDAAAPPGIVTRGSGETAPASADAAQRIGETDAPASETEPANPETTETSDGPSDSP